MFLVSDRCDFLFVLIWGRCWYNLKTKAAAMVKELFGVQHYGHVPGIVPGNVRDMSALFREGPINRAP